MFSLCFWVKWIRKFTQIHNKYKLGVNNCYFNTWKLNWDIFLWLGVANRFEWFFKTFNKTFKISQLYSV